MTQPPQARAVPQCSAEQGHHDVERLPGAEGEPVGRIVSEEVDKEARERVPEHEAGRGRARRRVHSPHVHQVRHQQQVLRPVVQHHRMAKPVRIRKLDRPPHLRYGTDDLAVDEVPESPDPHEERRRNDKCVRKEQERLPVQEGKESRADRATEHQPMGGHPPEPVGGNQPEVLPIEGPFVERDLDGAAPDEDADGHE